MNKFTKLSAAALLAVLLAACDKPATNGAAAEAAKPAATQESPEAIQAQGVADFKKLLDWNQSQESSLASFQAELQQALASGDKAKIEAGIKTFGEKVDGVLKSLDALDIKNADINAFKAKTKEVLLLSNGLITESVKVMANPTPEAQQAIQAKTQELMQAGQALQQSQAELEKKFAPAPAQPAPAAK
ncbi:lipoprotein HlpB [Pasteurellaceae bacterium LFhippo2]|nr:lipoprotein HlpB [Pasteurellaceae bacterium LFhippo2]